jgi:hypothetical protein
VLMSVLTGPLVGSDCPLLIAGCRTRAIRFKESSGVPALSSRRPSTTTSIVENSGNSEASELGARVDNPTSTDLLAAQSSSSSTHGLTSSYCA